MTTVDIPSPDEDWEAFLDCVLEAASHPLGRAWEALIAPGLVHRTKFALAELLRDLQETTAENKKTMPIHVYKAWRAKDADPVRLVLEARSREVRDIAHRLHQQEFTEARNESRAVASKLALAINEHRLATIAAGLGPEPHDSALWACLGQITISTGGEQLTLNEMIGQGHWFASEEERDAAS